MSTDFCPECGRPLAANDQGRHMRLFHEPSKELLCRSCQVPLQGNEIDEGRGTECFQCQISAIRSGLRELTVLLNQWQTTALATERAWKDKYDNMVVAYINAKRERDAFEQLAVEARPVLRGFLKDEEFEQRFLGGWLGRFDALRGALTA